MGYGNVAPAPVICTFCAATVAPAAATATATAIVTCLNASFISSSLCVYVLYPCSSVSFRGLERDQRVQRKPPLRRLRDDEVVERRLVDVEEERGIHSALMREPVRDPADGALARA